VLSSDPLVPAARRLSASVPGPRRLASEAVDGAAPRLARTNRRRGEIIGARIPPADESGQSSGGPSKGECPPAVCPRSGYDGGAMRKRCWRNDPSPGATCLSAAFRHRLAAPTLVNGRIGATGEAAALADAGCDRNDARRKQ
jgi:hypothetical protein